MQNRLTQWGTAAALSLFAFPALAQEDVTAVPDVDPAEEATEESVTPPAPTTVPDAPLEDYESSEQISEDLSVSFPIDI